MKPERLLILLLILATLHVDAVVLAAAPRTALTLFTVAALERSQVSLLALWLALGRSWLPWRLMMTTIALVAWLVAIHWFVRTMGLSAQPAIERVICTMLLHVLGISAACLAAMAVGLRLIDVADESTRPDQPTRPRFQFTIGYLLAWMTALAVVLSAAKSFAPFDPLEAASLLRSTNVLMILVDVALALACAGIVLKARLHAWQWTLLAGAGLGVLGTLLLATKLQNGPWALLSHPRTVISLMEAILLTGSLGVIRLAGFRLGTCQRNSANPQAIQASQSTT